MKGRTRFLLSILLFAATPAGATVVADQIGDPAAYDFGASATPNASQILEVFPIYSSMALDDFTVTAAELQLTRVSALFNARAGFSNFQGIQGYRVSVFSDPTLAGTSLLGDAASVLITLGADVNVTQIGAEDHGLVNLNVDFVLPAAGTYWVGVAALTSKTVTGEFDLQNSGALGVITPGGGNGYFANPGEQNGFPKLSQTALDYAYLLEVVPEPSAVGLLTIGAFSLLRRNRRPKSLRQP